MNQIKEIVHANEVENNSISIERYNSLHEFCIHLNERLNEERQSHYDLRAQYIKEMKINQPIWMILFCCFSFFLGFMFGV